MQVLGRMVSTGRALGRCGNTGTWKDKGLRVCLFRKDIVEMRTKR